MIRVIVFMVAVGWMGWGGVGVCSAAAAKRALTVYTQGSAIKVATSDGVKMLTVRPRVWATGWRYARLVGQYERQGGAGSGAVRGEFSGKLGKKGAGFAMDVTVRPMGERKVQVAVSFSVARSTDLTLAVVSVETGPTFGSRGRAVVEDGSGRRRVDLPFGRGMLSNALERLDLRDDAGAVYGIALGKPRAASMDGEARIVLASGHLAAERVRHVSLTLALPADARFALTPGRAPTLAERDRWFVWRGTGNTNRPSEISMRTWLTAPAGKYGWVTRQGEKLMYHGRPIKLWGINLTYRHGAPTARIARQRARFYARYGINCVRLHKFADGSRWRGILSRGSFVKFDPRGLGRMDYFVKQLKERGIYIELSANFGAVELGPDDAKRIPFAHELKREGTSGWYDSPKGAVWFSRRLQDLQIKQLINLLNHKNRETGLRYAEDRAVFCVELINENDSLFYTSLHAMQEVPAIKRLAGKAFFGWLKKRYGSKEALLAAWGRGTLNVFADEKMIGESWTGGEIYPVGNPWFFAPAHLNGKVRRYRQRLLDTMRFLYDQQNRFYERFVKAIRDTGYQGLIVASNWRAGSGYSNYANLDSDARIGMIDRHSYFTGSGSMLARPGGGMLSAGMQQVDDRPFMLSEWIHVFPNEFAVEGPAIIGAYGMGLNGWDVSEMFQNGDKGTFTRVLGRQRWDVMAPQVIGIFPAVARQVLRGDVKESKVTFRRQVYVPGLFEGKLGFTDRVTPGHDVTRFGSSVVPAAALAIGRNVVDFTASPQRTQTMSLVKYLRGGMIHSTTGQLAWKPGVSPRDGYMTINTAGTQAVVGFAKGQRIELEDVDIVSRTHFAAIYVTALDRHGTIGSDRRVLITTIARVRNTGMRMIGGDLLDRGEAPLRVEPVSAVLTLKRSGTPRVYVLDADGRRTGRTVAVKGGKLVLDGARTRTIYYELMYH